MRQSNKQLFKSNQLSSAKCHVMLTYVRQVRKWQQPTEVNHCAKSVRIALPSARQEHVVVGLSGRSLKCTAKRWHRARHWQRTVEGPLHCPGGEDDLPSRPSLHPLDRRRTPAHRCTRYVKVPLQRRQRFPGEFGEVYRAADRFEKY